MLGTRLGSKVWFISPLVVNMTKGNLSLAKKTAMPFGGRKPEKQPRSLKQRQKSWVLSGLRQMKAPLVGGLEREVEISM